MTSPKLIDIIHQITRRYRHALLANLSVLAVLSLGVVGVLAWRLYAIGLDREWVVGIPGALAVAAATTLGWLLRRRWISVDEAASHLDRTLGLQERLLTAAEFAHRSPPPTLYAFLVEDAAHHFSTGRVRFPRILDRPGIALAIVLLVLLCWPGRGNLPMQLAHLPSTPTPVIPPQPEPPAEPPQDQQENSGTQQSAGSPQQERQQGPGSGQQTGQGKSQPSQGQQQGQGSHQPSPGSGQQKPDSGQETTDQRSETGDRHGQTAQAGRDQMHGERGQQDGGEQRKGSTPQGSRQQAAGSDEQQAAGSDEQQAADGAKPAGQQGSQGRDQTEPQGKGQPGTAQPIPSNTQQAGQSGGQSVTGEVTKAEIQQLLKEVSQELKQLQAQLAAANDEPAPEPGTSTDPELYGAAEALDRAKGSPLPVQLGTDTVETKAKRPGGGVGQPAGEAASATPQTQAEDAQLSEQPLEETPAGRQTIPPEYRPVFDRLHQQRDTTR